MNGLLGGLALVGFLLCAGIGLTLLRRPASNPTMREPRRPDSPEASNLPRKETKTRSPLIRKLLHSSARRTGPFVARFMSPATRERIHSDLEAAGHPLGMTVERFLGIKGVFILVFTVVGMTHVAAGRIFVGVAAVAFGYFVMDLWLRREVRARQALLDRDLPGFLEVLTVSVSAGVQIGPALRLVAAEAGGPLGSEFARTLDEHALGDPLQRALERLRGRNPAPGLGRATSVLIDTLELGTPLVPALAGLSADMRQTQREEVLTRAARTAPRITLVVSFTLVPACLAVIAGVLLVGPATSLWEVFGA